MNSIPYRENGIHSPADAKEGYEWSLLYICYETLVYGLPKGTNPEAALTLLYSEHAACLLDLERKSNTFQK